MAKNEKGAFVSKTFNKEDRVSDLGNIRSDANKSREVVVSKSKEIGRKTAQKFINDSFKSDEVTEEKEEMKTNELPVEPIPKGVRINKEALKKKDPKKNLKKNIKKKQTSKFDFKSDRKEAFVEKAADNGFDLTKESDFIHTEKTDNEDKGSGNEEIRNDRKKKIQRKYIRQFNGRNRADGSHVSDDSKNNSFLESEPEFKESATDFERELGGLFVGENPVKEKTESKNKKIQKEKIKADSVKRFAEEKKKYSMEKVFDKTSGLYVYKVTEDAPKEKTINAKDVIKKNYSRELSKKFLRKPIEAIHEEISKNDEDSNSAVEAANEVSRSSESAFDFVVDKVDKKATAKEPVNSSRHFDFKVNFDKDKFIEKKPPGELVSNSEGKKRIQKLHIKKKYEKARNAARSAETAADASIEAAKITTKIAKKLQDMIAAHAKVFVVVILFALLLLVLMGMLVSCGAAAGSALTSTISGTYQSVPAEIDAADLQLTQLEMDLQTTIDNIERDHPDYDEYTYNLGEIGHDPYVLINYLSAKYIDFQASGVASEVLNIFNAMYNLTLTPVNETRTRTVHNDETGEDESQEYTVKILRVTLVSTPITTVVNNRMNADTRDMNDVYSNTRGALQIFASPVDYYWYNYISSYYGYRKNPNTGAEEIHRGLDIAVPDRTTVYATHDGVVSEASYDSYYGNYVVIDDSRGYTTKYGHLSSLSVATGQSVREGTILGYTGNTGTTIGSYLHVECLYNGQYYNPLFYFNAGDQTMYGENTGGSGETDFNIPPYSDAQVSALIREAERYLHMPYVWGGSSPSTGFDCSGFVCWVFKNSGTYPLERTTGQGIYNKCTPVSSSDARAGDIIFFTGTYNSGHPVSHVGIYCGNGVMIHCGDPIKYASINTPYWQSHFYGFGRLSN